MSTGAVTGAEHGVLRGLDLVRQGLDLLIEASAWSLGTGEVRDALVDLDTQRKRAEAARLALVRESVAREDGPAPGALTRRVLQQRCRLTTARAGADLANAALVAPTGTLPALGAALATGQVSREHLDVARRALTALPARVLREHGPLVDTTLTQHARTWNSRDSSILAAHLLAVVVPDRADRYDPDATDRRQLHTATDSTGMLLIRAQLDPAAAPRSKPSWTT